ncbi:MAG: ABC transporter ATP-binding protein, partial [Ktedonobacteraceae bacterium]|nr:ABC transporter ATP-binding protein [Ktedonobacteraceae bacterium]
MGFIMDGLDAEAYDRTYKDSALIGRIIGYFRPKLGVMLFVALLVVLSSLLDAIYPVLISNIVDTATSTMAVQAVVGLIGFVLLASVLAWTCNMLRQWFSAKAVGDVVLQLRKDVFASVMERDMSFFDEFNSGKIVSRTTSDTDAFANTVTLTLNLISQLLLFVLVAGVLISRNWRLALLMFTILPAILIVALGFRKLARSATRR